MSYEIRKPITEKERADFIVQYNHNQGLRIEDTEMYLFALEKNEIMGEKEIEIEVPDYDEEGNPIMIEYEDTETVIDYDEEGNPIGSHEITVIKTKQQTHIETITIPYPIVDPDYEEKEAKRERERLDMLSLTKREVFLALYRAKGITPEMVRGSIQDEEALIEFDYAERFYRGNPLIDAIGFQIGYSSEDLDYLFENKELKV